MTKEEALDLQATVNGILALAAGELSRIGGPVNWADLHCVDVEMSLIDGHVTVTIEEAPPSALELCRCVAKELALTAGAARTRRDRGQDGMVICLGGSMWSGSAPKRAHRWSGWPGGILL
jgi:hypothetical protein